MKDPNRKKTAPAPRPMKRIVLSDPELVAAVSRFAKSRDYGDPRNASAVLIRIGIRVSEEPEAFKAARDEMIRTAALS